MTDIPDTLVERAFALARSVMSEEYQWNTPLGIVTEARAIVAELPKSTDSDLIEAREITAAAFEWFGEHLTAERIRAGAHDVEASTVERALAAIKAGPKGETT